MAKRKQLSLATVKIRLRGLLHLELIGLMLLLLELWNSIRRRPRASRSQELELGQLVPALQHQEVDRSAAEEAEEEKPCPAATQKLRWSSKDSKEAKSRPYTRAALQIKKSSSGRDRMAPMAVETQS